MEIFGIDATAPSASTPQARRDQIARGTAHAICRFTPAI
jgi:hypothetical protein